jgi:hypothetical protein
MKTDPDKPVFPIRPFPPDHIHCKRIVSKLLVRIKWLTNRCM